MQESAHNRATPRLESRAGQDNCGRLDWATTVTERAEAAMPESAHNRAKPRLENRTGQSRRTPHWVTPNRLKSFFFRRLPMATPGHCAGLRSLAASPPGRLLCGSNWVRCSVALLWASTPLGRLPSVKIIEDKNLEQTALPTKPVVAQALQLELEQHQWQDQDQKPLHHLRHVMNGKPAQSVNLGCWPIAK